MLSPVAHPLEQATVAESSIVLFPRRRWSPVQLRIVREEVIRIQGENRRWTKQDYVQLQCRIGDSPSVQNKVAAIRRELKCADVQLVPTVELQQQQQDHSVDPQQQPNQEIQVCASVCLNLLKFSKKMLKLCSYEFF